MGNRTVGQAGLELIMQFEGCRLKAYRCAAGVWTIGYGHTAGVREGQTITQEQAEAYLLRDCRKFENYVNNETYVPITAQLNQNQFDALVSFTFNCGAGNLKKLCAGRNASQIVGAMPQYCKAAGRTLAGLVRRRKAEVELFHTPLAGAGSVVVAQSVETMRQADNTETLQKSGRPGISGESKRTAGKTEDYNMKTIKKGSKGKAVRVWQIIVGETPDGNFGIGTESATKNWQAGHGLVADGIVGAKSWKVGLESL